ncbi:hypothetical protein RINTHM_5490 [Richelia intracellularis HM01]|nr:hypothetical protein RINTHM_5490 [Richelia intracellularis HM01]
MLAINQRLSIIIQKPRNFLKFHFDLYYGQAKSIITNP